MSWSRILIVCAGLASSALAQGTTVTGKVDRVTLYRGQAVVSRLLTVDGAAGPVEIVVDGLPEQVIATSLFAEAADGIEVRAVRFRATAVSEEPRDAVRALDDQLKTLAEKAETNTRTQELVQKRLVSLEKLENFVAPTATVEISKGVLDAEALERLTLFNFEQRKKATEDLLGLARDAKAIEAETNLLNRRRAELTQGAAKNRREAVLFLEKRRAGPAPLRLGYIVANCGWSPAYNFRAAGDMTSVDVECNALIQQMSGEDWADVELTLSTATPGLNAAGPGLAPFIVDLRGGQQKQQEGAADPASVLGRYNVLQMQRQVAAHSNQLSFTNAENYQTAWAMNEAANGCQTLEILAGKDILGDSPASPEGPSLSYPIESKVSLASRPDQQLVRLAAVKLKSKAYHLATPVLTNLVYREAEIVNTSPFDFLGGSMSVYLDGRFVGRGEFDSVARGQTFVVGFGADAQLKARREHVDKSEKIQGGNKMATLKYRLVIENFKDAPVNVRVQERVPYAERSENLTVTLGEMSSKLSDDPTYVRLERPMGILRWEVSIPASSSGEKAFMLTYAYTLEHDRNLGLALPAGEANQKAQQEFEQLQKRRQGK